MANFQAVIVTLFLGTFFGSHSFPGQSLLLSTTILNDENQYRTYFEHSMVHKIC